MDFGFSAREQAFRRQVRERLRSEEIAAELSRLDAGGAGEPDERPLYLLLGEHDLLAVDWPERYAGAGRSRTEAVIAAEELFRAGMPDTQYVNGILTVGRLILTAGSPDQRRRFLPGLARGRLFASILYTEPGNGSDLAGLTTVAVRAAGGFRLRGVKAYNLKSGRNDFALCAARTGDELSGRYAALTLFLVDLRADGVSVRVDPGIADEQFHVVDLDDVFVPDDDVLGEPGDGWALISSALPFERTGMDFALRAERWSGLAARHAAEDDERVARIGARVTAAGLLAWWASGTSPEHSQDTMPTAIAKWYCSETAAEAAHWAHETGAGAASVSSAYREAPGVTLAGGTSEMMLQLIAGRLGATEG
jgi:alkylation response protein AidB-like acyl-CoA dehydrogenase